MFKAKDLMTTHVVTVREDDTVDHAIALMVRHRISGLVVVDREGHAVGVVSEFDLLELICQGHTEQDLVSRFMSPDLFGVSEEDSWVTLVDTFRERHVRRLPVLRDGKLVGIVTRHDLMHAVRDARQRIRRQLAQQAEPAPGPARGGPSPRSSLAPHGAPGTRGES